MKKIKLKWVILTVFILAGVWAAIIAPQAVESMLPEVITISPKAHILKETVRGSGVIHTDFEGGYVLTISVREGDINAVKERQPAELYGPAIGDGIFKAAVRELGKEAQQREIGGVTETVVDVVLEIVNPNELLRTGYTAEAFITVGEPREILLIPYEAINQDDSGEYVLALIGNTAVRRNITTGLELAEGAEVLAGVSPEDELILKPAKYTAGMLVRAGV